MVPVLELVYRPKLRCFGQGKHRNGLPCGRQAVYMRAGTHPEDTSYFCDRCRQPGDTAIAADAPFRRVTVMVEVHLAGTSRILGAAHAEALARIQEHLEPLGGMVTAVSATSVVGRVARQPGASSTPAEQGSRG